MIVARAFAPAGTTWKYARLPFDPVQSGHGTHVAGIAAGNANTTANGNVKVSGIAPRAYIGNYKALSVPTDADVGLDGNAPELVAAIEAAVADGMDVINLSIGEPEIEPSRDLVALALDAAAAAGVVPVVAAGNDFDEFGRGSLSSPGTSEKAITVAAVTSSSGSASSLADFSASGPTPLSLRLKPDVSAPGVSILSSVPNGALGDDVGHVDGKPADRRRRRVADRTSSVLVRRNAQGRADRIRQRRRRSTARSLPRREAAAVSRTRSRPTSRSFWRSRPPSPSASSAPASPCRPAST